MNLDNYDTTSLKIRICMTGSSGTGKSSIACRYDSNTFDEKITQTIGLDFLTYFYRNNKLSEDIKIEIWDTAGQERYRSIIKSYYHRADVLFIIFDVNEKYFLQDVINWHNEILENAVSCNHIYIVGNKIDKLTENEKEEKIKFIKDKLEELQYVRSIYFISAKTNENMDKLLDDVITKLYHVKKEEQKRNKYSNNKNNTINLINYNDNMNNNKSNNYCCNY